MSHLCFRSSKSANHTELGSILATVLEKCDNNLVLVLVVLVVVLLLQNVHAETTANLKQSK